MYNCTKINDYTVNIKYSILSMLAKWWCGGLPIIPKHIWEAHFPDWNTGSFNPSTVRTYHPWEVQHNVTLTEAIGTGAWILPYNGWNKGSTITLDANAGYYLTYADVNNFIVNSFWKYKGDVNLDGKISGADILQVLAHYGEAYPPGDFNENGAVDANDLNLVTSNYGKVAG